MFYFKIDKPKNKVISLLKEKRRYNISRTRHFLMDLLKKIGMVLNPDL